VCGSVLFVELKINPRMLIKLMWLRANKNCPNLSWAGRIRVGQLSVHLFVPQMDYFHEDLISSFQIFRNNSSDCKKKHWKKLQISFTDLSARNM
jgi:hypothetical protein